jgi:hypothetical protein
MSASLANAIHPIPVTHSLDPSRSNTHGDTPED